MGICCFEWFFHYCKLFLNFCGGFLKIICRLWAFGCLAASPVLVLLVSGALNSKAEGRKSAGALTEKFLDSAFQPRGKSDAVSVFVQFFNSYLAISSVPPRHLSDLTSQFILLVCY
ncbi:hypothetical protein Adt_45384 [Abeliophyllum distichum]|uniref:Uncharacterized protein n=1 Tax=Abeliophyllum distichum TaxID=126358 RepID=A0ABD1PG05_9LAMI